MSIKIYLAGPEVFLPNAAEVLAAKCELVRAAGFIPLAPGDAQVNPDLPAFEKGLAINAIDEGLMQDADAVIANLTPFRGVSADVGTAYELGFMAASGKPVFAYTNDARPYADRVQAALLVMKLPDGTARDASGLMVEEFAMADNLMLHGGTHRRGHPVIQHDGGGRIDDLTGFKRALELAVTALR
mgnify:CR=1 FL=1